MTIDPNVTLDATKVIRVLDAQSGKFAEETLQPSQAALLNEALAPYPRDRRGKITVDEQMMEAAGPNLTTANFPDLLRSGLMFDAFSSYNETPITWTLFAREVQSSKPQEEYLLDAALGIAPVVPEGAPYPMASVNLNDGVTIKNYKRGYQIHVTEEMRRFDMVGKVRDLAASVGRSLRITEEYDVYRVLTTTTNYNRNSTTNDNDEGANTAATTFGPAGLITAWNVLSTMKDRKSSMYLGVRPNVLVVAPKLYWAARQLIQSSETMRVGTTSANDTYGGGTDNPFFAMVPTIVVSPWIGSSYQWALLEANRAIYFQRLDPMTIGTPEYERDSDCWKYWARTWFGCGMKDDRFAYFSSSTTAPAIG